MKLLVPLRMAWIDSMVLAERHSVSAEMIGMPPATAASKAIDRPARRAAANSSGPCSASRALFAVITSLPLSKSFKTISRAGSTPLTSSITGPISRLPVTCDRSAVSRPGGRATLRARFTSGSTTRTSSTTLPAKRAIRSRRSSSSRATPDPTVPNPTMATLATSISTPSPLSWRPGNRPQAGILEHCPPGRQEGRLFSASCAT